MFLLTVVRWIVIAAIILSGLCLAYVVTRYAMPDEKPAPRIEHSIFIAFIFFLNLLSLSVFL